MINIFLVFLMDVAVLPKLRHVWSPIVHRISTNTFVRCWSTLAFTTYQHSHSSISLSFTVDKKPSCHPTNKRDTIILTSTPISNKTSGNHSYTSETHDGDSANYFLSQKSSGLFLGAMPPKKFLNMLLPVPPQNPKSKGDFENVLYVSQEVNMYIQFVSMVLSFVSGMLH